MSRCWAACLGSPTLPTAPTAAASAGSPAQRRLGRSSAQRFPSSPAASALVRPDGCRASWQHARPPGGAGGAGTPCAVTARASSGSPAAADAPRWGCRLWGGHVCGLRGDLSASPDAAAVTLTRPKKTASPRTLQAAAGPRVTGRDCPWAPVPTPVSQVSAAHKGPARAAWPGHRAALQPGRALCHCRLLAPRPTEGVSRSQEGPRSAGCHNELSRAAAVSAKAEPGRRGPRGEGGRP